MALAWPLDTMHTTSTLILILAVFGASSVEMVEALTIVVAAGVSRGWRSALEGAATAVVVLALLVGFIGVPLIHYVPIDTLRVVVGALLLVLGLAWLRKAILRASGHKAPHDEDRIYAETVAELSGDGPARRRSGRGGGTSRDGVAFAVAFKGVFLEGTEVVLIVVSLGASQGRLGLAALSAGAAAVVVAGVGVLVARQLSEVPENTIKTVVGVMLTSFGVFWVGEGAGVRWPGSDLAILGLVGFFVLVTLAGNRLDAEPPSGTHVSAVVGALVVTVLRRSLRAFGDFWWDFLIGDSPEFVLATGVIIALAFLLDEGRLVATIVLPLVAAAFLLASTYRGRKRATHGASGRTPASPVSPPTVLGVSFPQVIRGNETGQTRLSSSRAPAARPQFRW